MADTKVYLSGGRIQGRSDDGTTANRTPLHDIDFTEYADQSAGEAAWVSASTSGSNGYMVYDHTNKNLDCRNQGNSAGAKICYYDLGASVNATDWRLRFRINNSSFVTESTGGKSYYTGFSISNAYDTADTGSPDWFGLKFIADGGAAGQTQFYGTDGGSQSGTSMSFAPTVNSGVNDIFVEWHFVSGTCTCKFFTDSDYDTQISGTATVTKSTSVAGLRYFMVYLRQDPSGGNGDNEFVVDDLEFINGTLTETTDKSKASITNVPVGTRYEETDTRKIYRKVNKTDLFTDSFTSDSAWTKVGSKWLVDASTDNRVESLSYSSYAPNDYVYHDMGAGFHACDQSFNLRYKILIVGAGGYIQVGFTDNTTDGNSGDSLNAGLNSYNTTYGYTRIYDTVNGTFHEVETASSTTPSGMYNTAIWMEFAFNSTTNVATVKCFSDSGFTTPLNAGTQNLSHTLTMSDYQGLRYLFIGSIDASGRALDSNCYVDDLTLYTGISDVDDAVTVEWQEKGTA